MFKSFNFTPTFSNLGDHRVRQLNSRVRVLQLRDWSFNGRTFKASLKSSRLLDDPLHLVVVGLMVAGVTSPSVEFPFAKKGLEEENYNLHP